MNWRKGLGVGRLEIIEIGVQQLPARWLFVQNLTWWTDAKGKKNQTDALPDANSGNCLSMSLTVASLTLYDKANKNLQYIGNKLTDFDYLKKTVLLLLLRIVT